MIPSPILLHVVRFSMVFYVYVICTKREREREGFDEEDVKILLLSLDYPPNGEININLRKTFNFLSSKSSKLW